ncbi:hypothetical protein E3N88_19535 [Mikania micrantha]|uniref:Glycosyltransferase N-terminal domain-containing protein n=1 Tax=Mikania micrantha TaxID=192012 RepID=A0A5N6NPU1_9ASTR|nr:hypothetical protein E3N88_19535 [Mikania micrantha]
MSGDDATIPAADVAVVTVPFVAHGHLTQLLHLSHLISAYNITVHFITTTDCLRQLSSRHRTSAAGIHFHDFPVPPFTAPPPHPSIPFPTHLQPSFDATLHLRPPTGDLIRSLSQRVQRIVVIHDVLMSYVVQDVKLIPNAETYVFNPHTVFYKAAGHWEKTGGPFPVEPKSMNNLPTRDGISSPEFMKFLDLQKSHMNFHVGELYDSSRIIEGKFVEYLEKEEVPGKKKIWVVGPVNRVQIASNVTDSMNRHRCLQWLDNQPKNSVIYVSFGTTTTFSDDQINELALGLERSGQRFIWVVRAADTSGGFMSHCGWNSSMESISMGVPIVAWPMHSDQPRNAFLVTEVLGVGVAVKSWDRRDELVMADVVAEVVRMLMNSEKGEEMRRRAVRLGGEVKKAVAEGGVSCREMDSFISYVRRL